MVYAWLFCSQASFSYAAQAGTQTEKASSATNIESAQGSTVYRAGLKSIVVPPPADLRETGPDYRVLFEHDAPDSNRLLAAFLPSEDIAKLPARPEGGLVHYALLETLRQAEFVEIDEATFKQIEEAVAKQFGSSADAPTVDLKAFQDEVNHKLKAEGGTAGVSLDKPVMLGTFFSKPSALGTGMMMSVGAGGTTKKVIVGTAVLRTQNRLLYASVFAQYTGDDSLTWVRTISEQWADAILKANSQ